jgi:hypothetical protein
MLLVMPMSLSAGGPGNLPLLTDWIDVETESSSDVDAFVGVVDDVVAKSFGGVERR